MVHIGIIPDRNRTYCKNNNISKCELPNIWFNTIIDSIKNFFNNKYSNLEFINKITEISFYISSIDNVKRKDNSTSYGYNFLRKLYKLYNNLNEYFEQDIIDKLNDIELDINVNLIGDIHLIPKDLLDIYDKYKKFITGGKFNINLAICYDYFKDIESYYVLKNFKEHSEKYREVENKFKNYFRHQTNIDCVLRSGNEPRFSGFFPTKTIYTNLILLNKLWPEIKIEDIDNGIKQYLLINNNYGN